MHEVSVLTNNIDMRSLLACLDYHGSTPLHAAANIAHLEIIMLLIEHNTDVNAKSKSYLIRHIKANIVSLDKFQETALHIARKTGHKDIIKLLIKHTTE